MQFSQPSSDEPLVSVVITSYNRARFIPKAISSALSQSYPNIEVVISDNCSHDNTLEVIEGFKSDERVKFYQNQVNLGAIANFKKCLYNLAKGELITFISSDDYLLDEQFIAESVKRFTAYRSVVIVKGRNFTLFEGSGNIVDDATYLYWKHSYYKSDLVSGRQVFLDYPEYPSVGFGGSVYNRRLLCDVGFGENGDECLYADAESTLKLLSLGDVSFIETPTYVNRLHGENSTGNMSADDVIANEIYIQSVYSYLGESDFLDPSSLSIWREKMLVRYYSSMLKFYLTQNSLSYRKLLAYLSENQQSILFSINASLNWKIFYLISKFAFMVRVWASLGRVKALWLGTINKRN